MKLTDVPRHGDQLRPVPYRRTRLDPERTTEPCPECGRGRVIHLSNDPTAVRYVCSLRCGWDA